MCIIIAKEKLGRLPSEEELKNSFEYNNDGAGFMYVKDGKVVIDKGYMTLDGFLKHYRQLLHDFDNFKNKSLVIHCRIGTSGKNIKGNTHPFPITDNVRKLKAKHLSNEDIGVVHNGIIKGYGTITGLNDTQDFISRYIYPLYSHYKDFYKNEDIMYGLEVITGSKLVFLDSNDDLYYVGNFTDDKGLYFSNTSYKWANYYKDYYANGYSGYSSYYDDYDDDWYNKEYKKQEETEKNQEYWIQLEKTWYIDIYGNGDATLVGDKEYWYDYDSLELFEYRNGEYQLIAMNPLIYDERYNEIW